MFYSRLGEFGDFCGRMFGYRSMYYHSPWSWVIGILAVALVAGVVFAIVKSAKKNKDDDSDEALDILKAKYAAGEIDEEEYMRKKKVLKK